jgi:hypothetical protein
MHGYLSPQYAQSLSEFGMPCQLAGSAAWILRRHIPGYVADDATGCYPLFCCGTWSALEADLEDLEEQVVSLVAIVDPFAACDVTHLRRCFRDLVVPFKDHFVVDLQSQPEVRISDHHRRALRKARRRVGVEQCSDPAQFVDEWADLYTGFVDRKHFGPNAAFSRSSLARQLSVPGLIMFRALQDTTVGMHLWYAMGDVVYAHLAAYSPVGYRLGASYALFGFAIEYFAARGFRWLELGGVPSRPSAADGLAAFKRGWATGTRTAYLCGRILDRARYFELTRTPGHSPTSYFPAYRAHEASHASGSEVAVS